MTLSVDLASPEENDRKGEIPSVTGILEGARKLCGYQILFCCGPGAMLVGP